jgi:hypothetical protein
MQLKESWKYIFQSGFFYALKKKQQTVGRASQRIDSNHCHNLKSLVGITFA